MGEIDTVSEKEDDDPPLTITVPHLFVVVVDEVVLARAQVRSKDIPERIRKEGWGHGQVREVRGNEDLLVHC